MFKTIKFIGFIALLLVSTFIVPLNDKKPALGDMAPNVQLPDLNGNILNLTDLEGEVILLNFWSTWCVACNVIKVPEYVRLWEKYKDSAFDGAKGFVLYSVAFDEDEDKWRRRIAEAGMTWPHHVVDTKSYFSKYWKTYGLRSIPASFLIDPTGEIIGVNMSYSQIDQELSLRENGKRTEATFIPQATPPLPPPPPVVVEPTPIPQPEPELVPVNPPTNPDVVIIDGDGSWTPVSPSPGEQPPVNKPSTSPEWVPPPPPSEIPNTQPPAWNPPPSPPIAEPSPTPQPQPVETPPEWTPVVPDEPISPVNIGGNSGVVIELPPPPPLDETPPTSTPAPPPPVWNPPPVTVPNTQPETQTVYKIQLGVFGMPNLSAFSNLSDLGNLETEQATRTLQRVLLGTYQSDEELSAILPQVRARGYIDAFAVSRVINVAPTSPTPVDIPDAVVAEREEIPTIPPSSTTTNILRKTFKIQLGVFQMVNMGLFANVSDIAGLEVEDANRGLQRVLLGDFSDRPSAEVALQEVQNRGFQDAFIVKREKIEIITETEVDIFSDIGRRSLGNETMLSFVADQRMLTQSMVGEIAPEITLSDLNGLPHSLSSYEGRITVLHLWASWSGTARDNNVALKEIQDTYKNNNRFGIYSIAFDEDPVRWKQTVKEDNANWMGHVIDGRGMNSPLLEKYNAAYLPVIFLLDENGEVIAENISLRQLKRELKKRLN